MPKVISMVGKNLSVFQPSRDSQSTANQSNVVDPMESEIEWSEVHAPPRRTCALAEANIKSWLPIEWVGLVAISALWVYTSAAITENTLSIYGTANQIRHGRRTPPMTIFATWTHVIVIFGTFFELWYLLIKRFQAQKLFYGAVAILGLGMALYVSLGIYDSYVLISGSGMKDEIFEHVSSNMDEPKFCSKFKNYQGLSQCCGVNGPADWDNPKFHRKCQYDGKMCYTNNVTTGCLEKLKDFDFRFHVRKLFNEVLACSLMITSITVMITVRRRKNNVQDSGEPESQSQPEAESSSTSNIQIYYAPA